MISAQTKGCSCFSATSPIYIHVHIYTHMQKGGGKKKIYECLPLRATEVTNNFCN